MLMCIQSSPSRDCRNIISVVAKARDLYPDYVLDLAITFYFLDLELIRFLRRNKQKQLVVFLSSKFDAQLSSEYASKIEN